MHNSYLSGLQSADEVSPHVSATMRLNTYLIHYYNCSQRSLDTKFPHLPNKAFINLAVIEKESVNRANADSFTKGTLHGHADEILQKKEPIELDAVLELPADCQRLKCVFVEGAPGVGKSTFALELCRRKGEIESLKRFSLAILLRLREKEVQQIKNVSDLFYFSDPSLQQSVTKEVVSCGGENVLFVLDGFDEFPNELRQQSFLVELIQGKHLPACTVLVTSRPSATADLLFVRDRLIDKHMEILGFTHDRIKQYAESMLSDQPDVYEDFLKYIDKNPAIHGMMYIPLNSAIVVEIYKANRATSKPIPCTLTQLYTQLCLVLLRKYVSEKGDPLAEKLPDDFNDLPKSLKEQLFKLGKLAFEGALKQEITFYKLPDGCEGLGFMNVSTSLYLGTKSVLYHSFLHLTLQEFVGALYISQLPRDTQKIVIIEKFDILRKRDYDDYWSHNSHLDVMLRFIAGLTELKNVGWELAHRYMQSSIISINISQHVDINECLVYRPFYRPLLVQCLLEIQSEQTIKNSCDVILKDASINGFSVFADTPFDCYAVGYCVAASGHKWNIMTSTSGGGDIVEMVGCGLQSAKHVCGSICNLLLSKSTLRCVYLSEFPLSILIGLHTLDFSHNQLTKSALDILANSIALMRNLLCLDLSDNPAGEGGMVKVFHALICTKIRTLVLVEMGLGNSDIHALSQLIQPDASLKKLVINVKNIPCELVIKTILSSSSLENVTLLHLTCTSEGASEFHVLENNNSLTSLNFNFLHGSNLAVLHIAKALHRNVSLKEIDLDVDISVRCRTIDLRTSVHGSRMILRAQSFAKEQCLDRDSIQALSEMLEVNETLQSLHNLFISCNVSVVPLKNALNKNRTVEIMSLHEVDHESQLTCSYMYRQTSLIL